MNRPGRFKFFFSLWVFFHSAAPMFSAQAEKRIDASGTYRGTTEEGQSVVLTVQEQGGSFHGVGKIDDEVVVIAGPRTWSAVASLLHADGTVSLTRLNLSADGELLTLEAQEQPPLVLKREGEETHPPPGPLSGHYQGAGTAAYLVTATIVQSANLISGVGVVAGEPVGISGTVLAERKAGGLVTFLDGSQVRFEADFSTEGRRVTLRGFGDPLELERK